MRGGDARSPAPGDRAADATNGGAEGGVLAPTRSRLDLWVPALYMVFSAAWIAFSNLLLAALVRSTEQLATWSIVKGFAFVAVTAILLHAGLRWALARERNALQRVEKSEALLRTITGSIPDPVFLKDRSGRWLFVNRATAEVVGKPAEQLLGRTDREIYGDRRVGEALMATDRRIMESGIAEEVEEDIQTPGGYRVFLSAKAPYRDAEGRIAGVIGSARDITDRKRAEEALRTT